MKLKKKEVLGYLLVGIAGLVVDTLCFFLAQRFGATLLIAQWIGATMGALHNQAWHHYVVFEHTQSIKKTTLYSFFLVVISIVISGPLLLGIESVIHHIIISKALVIGIITITGFLIRKVAIFTDKE